MSITMWRNIPGFRIRRKKDIETLLKDVCLPNNVYRFICGEDKVLSIYKDKYGAIEVTAKFGDIFNCFVPELVLYDDQITKELFKARKFINHQLFDKE